ncbi:type II toxin-antitoxin system RelE/ParE family toxin [Chromobacterium amazonense]|uniref:type II toxin-antitoxin system RelE/ParE family toxin n=1 Tax=Chromobacterium amazonense TaxID=1382803 RepID=UPI003F798258
MRVLWLKKALKDFEAEAAYLHENHPAAAQAMAQAMRAAVQGLVDFPARGRPGRVPGTRELVLDGYPYLIPYRVKGDTVQILRLFHTSRRLPKRW